MKLPQLNGSRIFLRALQESDATEAYVGWLNDPAVNRFLETRHSIQDMGSVKEFVHRLHGKTDEFLFGIFLKETNQHLGNIKLGPVNSFHQHADISLFLGEKAAWGGGFATEAIGLITGWAIETLKLNKLKAGCYAANEGSARAFEKNGFKREGLLRDHLLFEGSPMDMIILGLSAKDYRGASRG